MKIICGTDFSEHAVQAGLAAAALARRLGDTLVLAHVWDETLGEGLWQDFHDKMAAAVRMPALMNTPCVCERRVRSSKRKCFLACQM